MSDEKTTRTPRGIRGVRSRTASTDVMVIGLGRFGSSLALSLEQNGRAVFGVDADPERVADAAPLLTQAAVADTTHEATLRQLGADDFATVIVAIGDDVEASILTTSALVDLAIPIIWARAVSAAHGRILERVGAHHVVQPLRDMGRRVAHLVTGNLVEFVSLDDGFSIAAIVAPATLAGRTLEQLQLRARYAITVVAVKPAGGSFTYATPDTLITAGDLLALAGRDDAIEAFATLP